VQVMFTVPKSKLRVVNADIDGASILSDVPPRDAGDENGNNGNASPTRVKDLAGRFEQMSGRSTPRMSPRPSPSNSIKSLKVRSKGSSASLARQTSIRSARLGSGAGMSPLGNGKGKEKERE